MIEHHHHNERSVAEFALPLLRGEAPPPVNEADAPRIAEGLRRAGLTALALRRLAENSQPAALTSALVKERNHLRADLALLYDRLDRLSEVLGEARVPFIVLKGAALAPLLYEAPELRPMVDVDILIRRERWDAARSALAAAGYLLPGDAEQAYWLANYFNLAIRSPDPRSASFDVHWGLSQEIRYRVDEGGLWERSVPFPHEGREFRRLGNEDLLLSLLLHLAYHYFDARLLWLYDIHLLCRQVPMDWEVVRRRAGEWGMATIFHLGLAYVEKAFPGSVPARVIQESLPGPLHRALLAPLRSPRPDRLFRGDDRRPMQLVQGLLVMDSPRDALRFGADKVARRLRFLGSRPRLR